MRPETTIACKGGVAASTPTRPPVPSAWSSFIVCRKNPLWSLGLWKSAQGQLELVSHQDMYHVRTDSGYWKAGSR